MDGSPRTLLGLGLLLLGLGGAAFASSASAQAAERERVPRTLQGGAPSSRLHASARKRSPVVDRGTPAPSITLERRPGAADGSGERRSAALLQREIALLQRLIANTRRNDMRRADVLLRLAYAYQELMWLQKVRLHQLQTEGGQGCACRNATASLTGAVLAQRERRCPAAL